MKIGRGNGSNHFRKDGIFAGYADYRYGTEQRRPVYDPSKPQARAAIMDKTRKKQVIKETASTLREWETSAFEHEAACRHGLRSGFCENGAPWQQADDEAAYIVREALHANGAKRPTWDQGQWHHTAGQDNCAWCHREIDDPNATRGQRYCSTECATLAVQHRGGREAVRYDNTVRQAYRQVAKAKAKPKPCEHCGEMYRSARKGSRFCSVRCMRHGTQPIRQEQPCKECGAMFLPQNRHQIFCSHSCATTVSVRERRLSAEPRCCDVCDGKFLPAHPAQRFCSAPCRKKLENLHQRVRKGEARLVPFAFDQYFTMPINASRPAWLTPERFDEMVGA